MPQNSISTSIASPVRVDDSFRVRESSDVPGGPGGRDQHVRTFGTTVPELLALRDWFSTHKAR